MKMRHIGTNLNVISILLLALAFTNGFAQESITHADSTFEFKKVTIAVAPICLEEAGDIVNQLSISSAEFLTDTLENNGAVDVISQAAVVNMMKKSNLSYNNVSGKNLGEIARTLSSSDIFIFIGPLRKDGWFPYIIGRTSDMAYKSSSKLLVEGDELEKGFTEELLSKTSLAVTIDDIKDVVNELIDMSFKDHMKLESGTTKDP